MAIRKDRTHGDSIPEKKVFHKIDFSAVWPRSGYADSVGVNKRKIYLWKIRIFENVDARLTFLSVIDKNSSSKSTTRPPLLQEFQMNEKLEKEGKKIFDYQIFM